MFHIELIILNFLVELPSRSQWPKNGKIVQLKNVCARLSEWLKSTLNFFFHLADGGFGDPPFEKISKNFEATYCKLSLFISAHTAM